MITCRIEPKNVNTLKFDAPQDIELFFFDSILNCNIKCVYCHNERHTTLMKEEDLQKFLDTQIASIKNFSLGCAMEPTLDKRLGTFAQLIGKSRVKPSGYFKLQSNATMFHLHNFDILRDAGINMVCVSLDSVDPEVHKQQRGGSDLNKIIENIQMVRKIWPDVPFYLVATVTNLSAPTLSDFCKFGIDNGIKGFTYRKLFYYPENDMIADGTWMQNMLMSDDEFDAICETMKAKYGDRLDFYFENRERLDYLKDKVIT